MSKQELSGAFTAHQGARSLRNREDGPLFQRPASPAKPATPLRIVAILTASRRKWIARLDDRVLCVSNSPFVKSARLLLSEGHPADAVIEMWRPNTEEWALRGRLADVAATVIDGEAASPSAKNGSPARGPEEGPL